MTTADALRRPATRTSLSREHLAAPPRTDRPGIRWWWQTPLPVGELLDELRAIAAARFGEVEIAFSPGFWADAAQREALAAAPAASPLVPGHHLGASAQPKNLVKRRRRS